MGNKNRIKKVKFITIALVLVFITYILAFSAYTEIISRNEDIKEIEEHFASITEEITYIYETKSEEALHNYLDNLVSHPYIKYAVCYKHGEPEMLYTSEKHIDFKKLDDISKSKVGISMKNISLEKYISLRGRSGQYDKTIYLALFEDRNYNLLSGAIPKILIGNIIITGLFILLINFVICRRIYKSLEEINRFVGDLSIGKTPGDLKIDAPEMQGIVKSLNEIKEQLVYIRDTEDTIHEEVVLDILDIVEEVIDTYNRHNRACANITEIMCKKIKKAVCCSLWLGDFSRDAGELKVHRKSIYYFEDQFPVAELTPISEALAKEVMQSGRVKIIRDFQEDDKYEHFKEAHPLAIIVIPVQVKGIIIGSLCIWKSRIPYSEVFSFRTQQLANYVGKVTGSVMEGCDYIFADEG